MPKTQMPLISTIYLIIFLPLISGALCLLFKDKFLPFVISFATVIAVILLLANIFPDVNSYQKVSNNFNLSSLSVGLEFLIDKVSLAFLFLLIFLQLTILLCYRSNFESALNKNNRAIFYAVFLLNIFSTIGVFTTNELLNLFIFLEIFSLSFFALISISLQNLDLLRNNFRHFCLAAASKLVILFCFLTIFLIFGSGNFTEINNNFIILTKSNEHLVLLLSSLLFIFLAINFFPFWITLKNLLNQSVSNDFALFLAIFIKANVGIYVFIRLIYFIFSPDYFINNTLFLQSAMAIALVLICYFTIEIFFANRIRSLAVNLSLANISFLLMLLFIANQSLLKLIFAYLFLFNLSTLLIYIFAGFLKSKFGNSSITNIIKCRKQYYFLLSLLIISYFLAVLCFLLISFFFAKSYSLNFFEILNLEEFFVATALILMFFGQIALLRKLTIKPKQELEIADAQ